MFKKSLYVATALLSLALTVPVYAQDIKQDSRQDRKYMEKDKFSRLNEYSNRNEDRREYLRDRDSDYRTEERYYRVEYRDDRHHHRDERWHHRHHHHDDDDDCDYHAHNEDLHLISHVIIALGGR